MLTRSLTLTALLAVACSGKTDDGPANPGGTGGADDSADSALPASFDPYQTYATAELAQVRGWELKRGQLHVHSVYSGDACDEEGFLNEEGDQDYVAGSRNEQCFSDLRAGFCDAALDWAFLTDHDDHYADFEYPDVLMVEPGDTVVEQDGAAVANRMLCPDGDEVLLTAGVDVRMLAVGLKRHVADTVEARYATFAPKDETTVNAIHDVGGLALGGYVWEWVEDGNAEAFMALDWDAIEIYNPRHNLTDRLTEVLTLGGRMISQPETIPVPELGLYAVFEEDTEALAMWAQLAQIKRAASFMGSNAHRNVLPEPTWDGERLDSYRRTFHWFSTYALLEAGSDPSAQDIQDAVGAGRMYSAQDAVGTPEGFDFVAEQGGVTFEMGEEAPAGETTLRVVTPTVKGLTEIDDPPQITSRILKAEPDGTWTVVAEGGGEVVATVSDPGAYRAEVRILPHHLVPFLGDDPDSFLHEVVWVYGNLIYIGMNY